MPQSISLEQRQKQSQSLKQMQRLIMSPQMQQAIQLLQMPIMELADRLDEELTQNPVLENNLDDSNKIKELEFQEAEPSTDGDLVPEKELSFEDKNFEILKRLDEEFRDHFAESGNYYNKRTADEEKLKTFADSLICSKTSLFEHLMSQAHEMFDNEDERAMAEAIIGNFDESGFLGTALSEIAALNNFNEQKLEELLSKIQTFDPYGVGAKNLQESLLIQLRRFGKAKSLAYRIISDNYEDLLHNRIPIIQKNLGCTIADISRAIEEDICRLDLHPGTLFSYTIAQPIIPDVTIREEGEEGLVVSVNDDTLPPLRLNRQYMRMMEDETLPQETKEFIKQKVMSAKWFLRNIHQRNETIEKIAQSLARRQKDFFLDPTGKLVPLTMRVMAEDLGVHESTIARAVANKYVNSPRGLLPLRSFFTNAYVNSEGEDISSNTVRDELQAIIQNEDKRKPFSDEAISLLLKAKGIQCARRTVAKYRTQFNIGNAQQRRKFS